MPILSKHMAGKLETPFKGIAERTSTRKQRCKVIHGNSSSFGAKREARIDSEPDPEISMYQLLL